MGGSKGCSGGRSPTFKSLPPVAARRPKHSDKWLHWAMFVFVTRLCLVLSGALVNLTLFTFNDQCIYSQ